MFDLDSPTEQTSAGPRGDGTIRIVSWNLLRRTGAQAEDVAQVVRQHHPDLLLLQEATEEIARLPSLVGGHFFRHPMHARIYGLAAWSALPFPSTTALRLPYSVLPGRVPPRDAQIINFCGINIANVHLSHGQFLNRWQLLHIAEALEGPAAIIGDYNALGPIQVPAFEDVGPRQNTLRHGRLGFRLDRCMARGLDCSATEVLDKGPSDHHPIVLTLTPRAEYDSTGRFGALARLAKTSRKWRQGGAELRQRFSQRNWS